MVDALGWRMKFGVIAPSTNTVVQPEFDAMRPRGVTNHFARIHIPNDPIRNDDDFTKLIETVRGELMAECRPRRSGTVSKGVKGCANASKSAPGSR
jgi:hypothetical protein